MNRFYVFTTEQERFGKRSWKGMEIELEKGGCKEALTAARGGNEPDWSDGVEEESDYLLITNDTCVACVVKIIKDDDVEEARMFTLYMSMLRQHSGNN